MNKKEYAIFHYLLAKIKYELFKNKFTTRTEEIKNMCDRQINAIEELEKICIIDWKEI